MPNSYYLSSIKEKRERKQREKNLFLQLRDDPIFFFEYVLGYGVWSKQRLILDAIAKNDAVCIRSGHGVGKTFTLAGLVLWFLYTRPHSKCITTAPTFRQVHTILWGEIRRLYNTAKIPLGGECLETTLKIADDWFGIGLSTKDADKFKGYHSGSVFIIKDEAVGIPQEINEAIEGAKMGEEAKIIEASNPSSPIGDFYSHFSSSYWHPIHISCFDSPNVTGECYIPGLVTSQWIEERRADWSEDSPLWQTRVLGNFAEESEDILFPLSLIEGATKIERDPIPPYYIGVDVARYGKDRSIIAVISDNLVVTHLKELQGCDTMEVSGEVSRLRDRFNAELIGVDVTGVGAGVFDRLSELRQAVHPVLFGGEPNDKGKYKLKRDEMYGRLREMFEKSELPIPDNSSLIADLADIRYNFSSDGKLKVESKDNMQKRGKRSPDYADALAIAVETSIQKSISTPFRVIELRD